MKNIMYIVYNPKDTSPLTSYKLYRKSGTAQAQITRANRYGTGYIVRQVELKLI
jgi:uncharacterized protein YdaL